MRTSWRDRFPSSMLTDRDALVASTKKLEAVLASVRPIIPSPYVGRKDFVDCSEVYPNVFLGNGCTAKNKRFLKKIGITHVVNVAMGNDFGLVDTTAEFYKDAKITFLGIKMMDLPGCKITQHFDDVADFIDGALRANGKVYVHCVMGVSRSATCVTAFLMIKRGMSGERALTQLRERRFVVPNEGFLQQLAGLDLKLSERRELEEETNDHTKQTKSCKLF